MTSFVVDCILARFFIGLDAGKVPILVIASQGESQLHVDT